ncbi:MAG: hypothetical protein QOK67_05660 [Nitrososphaeraceae archaeon]|nr:hypothetical protein [Nitrososphaeraceae archaeon]
MVSPLIPIAFSQEKIMELENKDYNVKLNTLKVGILGKVISNQVILIHKLQYFFGFKHRK